MSVASGRSVIFSRYSGFLRVITVFTVFRLLTDFVYLYTYEFWLSLCKIVRSSVILLLPLSTNKTDHYDIAEILLKVALNTIINPLLFLFFYLCCIQTRNILTVNNSLSSKSSGQNCSVIFRYKSIRHVWRTGDDKK